MINFNEANGNEISLEEEYVGYAKAGGNVVMIIFSVLGIIINSLFSYYYSKNIISIKNKNNAGISAVEKILSMIAIVETFISIFWLVNNARGKIADDTQCKVIAYFEIFFNLFDWLILSTSLYQIKIIILNPQEILEAGKRVYRYIIGCLIVSVISLGLSFAAEIGGKSPMLTCFISLDNLQETYQSVLFWFFFIVPIFCFLFGGYQVFLIMRSHQYKSEINNRRFFIEYSYFVITYIISSALLIVSYVIHYFLLHHTNREGIDNVAYKIFISLVTLLTCATPLIVGSIRSYRTGFFRRMCSFCKKRRYNIIEGDNGNQEELIDINIRDEGNPLINIENKMLENIIVKYYTAVSFALGKSKYDDEEGEIVEKEGDNPRRYIIRKDDILKDLDLSLNDDIKVLNETNIDMEVTEYNVSLFKKLRRLENLDEDKIIEVLQPKNGTHDLIHKREETFYINSSNKILMLKKIKREQMQLFQTKVLPSLYDYFANNNQNSILCRVFGLYRIRIEQQEEVFMALIYNIHETLGGPNSNVRQMKLSDNDFRLHMVRISRTVLLEPKELPTKGSIDVNDVTTVKNELKTSDTFKFLLLEEENEKFDIVMAKDTEFLETKGLKTFTFMIFEITKNSEEIRNLPLISENSLEDKNKSKASSDIMKSKIKKYEFKSNKENTIYCICINAV